MEYIKKLGESKLWNHGEVNLYDFSAANMNKEARIEAVTLVAGTCFGMEAKDKEKLYEQLETESAGKMSSSFEFVRGHMNLGIADSLRNNPSLSTFESEKANLLFLMSEEAMRSMNFNGLATFRVKIPQFICKQLIRHRTMAFQELSRRIKANEDRPLEYWSLWENWAVCVGKPEPEGVKEMVEDMYQRLICEGERPEVARSILPQGTYTTIWVQGDVPAFKNYFEVRIDPRAQKEHQELAKAMLDLLKECQGKFYEKVAPE